MNEQALSALVALLGSDHVLSDTAAMAPYLSDWRGRYQGQALCVLRPASTAEVAACVALCNELGLAVVAQGGNTGLVGGATPLPDTVAGREQVLLSLTRLKRIREVDVDNNTITVESGCILRQVQDAAAAVGRLFPLSLAAEGTATIGGNLSTNAGGVQVLRYGNMRELTLGLEVVLADGRIWDGLRGLRKDNTGYDLKQLFIGAEGTLGIITAAVLKLFPRPQTRATAWLALPDAAAAVTLLARLRERFDERVSAFELIGRSALDLVLQHIPGARAPLSQPHQWQLLVELSDAQAGAELQTQLEAALVAESERGLVLDAAVARSEQQAEALWQLRENISEAQRLEGVSIKHDVALPLSAIAEFITRADAALTQAYPGLRIVCFGHIGDGNLHYNQSKPLAQDNAQFIAQTGQVNRLVHDLVHQLGGSISAEHGLGQLKREEVLRYKSALEMELMRRIKQVLDPHGMFNPGKLL